VYVENHHVWGLRSEKPNPGVAGSNFKGAKFLGVDAPQRVDEDVMPLLTGKAIEWIEGDYHSDTKPGAIRLRAAQSEPQLYDLRADAAESVNLLRSARS